jgi:hypothetical protein
VVAVQTKKWSPTLHDGERAALPLRLAQHQQPGSAAPCLEAMEKPDRLIFKTDASKSQYYGH